MKKSLNKFKFEPLKRFLNCINRPVKRLHVSMLSSYLWHVQPSNGTSGLFVLRGSVWINDLLMDTDKQSTCFYHFFSG